eukprot:jgi/Mesvir1/551/Mv11404-RA.1
MLVETGEIFERSAIQGWFDRGNATDPWTRQPLTSTKLMPVRLLRRLVEDWVEQRKEQQRVEEEQEVTRKMIGALEDDSVMFIPPERLTLGREIGSGGMGIVRAAILQPSGKDVAVKMLPVPVLSQDGSAAFRREVKVLQRGSTFCHNVCRFLGVTKLDNHLCIVMFKYEQSLEDVIKLRRDAFVPQDAGTARPPVPNTCIPYPRLLLLAQDVCLAMADLHRQHIIVQDLKPANVLLDAYDRAVVADFGISLAVEHTLSARKATSIVGSVHYMAPEQHDPDEAAQGVTAQADVWAFGCLLVAMATGQGPWEGLQMRQVITNVLVRRQAPPVPEALPGKLQDMVRRCFSFEPQGRPSFDEMLVTLREAWGQQSQPPPIGTVDEGPAQGGRDLPSEGERPLHVSDWLSRQSQRGGQGSLEQTIGHRLQLECQQELQAWGLELTRKVEALEAKLKAMEELARVSQALRDEELARTRLELELVKSKGHGDSKKADNSVEKWQETYRCAALTTGSPPPPPLFLAARTGRLDVVKHFVLFGVDLNERDKKGDTVLHIAVEYGHTEVVRFLLEAGANVKATRSITSHTALHTAAAKGDVDLVRVLLAGGADVNATASLSKQTALDLAVQNGHLEMVKCLIKAGTKLDIRRDDDASIWPPLHWAAEKGFLDIVDALLAGGAEVNANRCMKWCDPGGTCTGYQPVLCTAIEARSLVLVKRLVEAGASPHAITVRNETSGYNYTLPALWTAVKSGSLEIVQYLVGAGADVHRANKTDQNQRIHESLMAAAKGQPEMERFLISSGLRGS